MLVLQRRLGQSIKIGALGEITVKILSQHDGVIRVGIDAPKVVQVDREEVYHQRQLQASLASASNDSGLDAELKALLNLEACSC